MISIEIISCLIVICIKCRKTQDGEKSFAEMTKHYRIRIENIINAGLNKLMRKSPAQVYIVEDLSHRFDYGNLPKPIRRRLSGWVKGVIRDRMLFKAAAHGAKIVMVPCSYSSQRCSECGYTDRENRHGEKFKCRHCGAQKQADANGALNLLLRAHDARYRRFMRKEEVWALERAEYEAGCMKREEKPLPNPKKAKHRKVASSEMRTTREKRNDD